MGAALRVLKICMVWAATPKQANANWSRLSFTPISHACHCVWLQIWDVVEQDAGDMLLTLAPRLLMSGSPDRPARLGGRLALITKFKFRAGDALLDFGSGFKPLRHVVHHLLDHWKSGVEVILV